MKILVTGASGFVGKRLCEHLREEAWEPCALVRPTSATEALEAAGLPVWVADFETGVGLEAALDGVDGVVHCAGGGRVRRPSDYWKQNTETTQRLVQAMAPFSATIRRMVLLSSLAARQPVSLYGRSKEAAEHLVREARVPSTVLRPPGIYGPGDDRLLPLFHGVQRGWVFVPPHRASVPWLHVDDCCRAIVACLQADLARGEVLEIDDGRPRPLSDLLGLIADLMSCAPPHRVRVPTVAMGLFGAGVEFTARLQRRPSLFNRDKARELGRGDLTMDSGPARQRLGWAPEVGLELGLAQTYRWLLDEGLLT